MSRNAIIAEAIRELAEGQDEILDKLEKLAGVPKLLDDIKRILATLSDGLGQHRQHTMQAVDDMGKDLRNVRSRVDAIERVLPGAE